jgi:hypothetical protein
LKRVLPQTPFLNFGLCLDWHYSANPNRLAQKGGYYKGLARENYETAHRHLADFLNFHPIYRRYGHGV